MKKITFLLATIMFLAIAKTNAQSNQDCLVKYNLFRGEFNSKRYDDAFLNWQFLFDNCKDLSINIYKNGAKIAQNIKKDPALAKQY